MSFPRAIKDWKDLSKGDAQSGSPKYFIRKIDGAGLKETFLFFPNLVTVVSNLTEVSGAHFLSVTHEA